MKMYMWFWLNEWFCRLLKYEVSWEFIFMSPLSSGPRIVQVGSMGWWIGLLSDRAYLNGPRLTDLFHGDHSNLLFGGFQIDCLKINNGLTIIEKSRRILLLGDFWSIPPSDQWSGFLSYCSGHPLKSFFPLKILNQLFTFFPDKIIIQFHPFTASQLHFHYCETRGWFTNASPLFPTLTSPYLVACF